MSRRKNRSRLTEPQQPQCASADVTGHSEQPEATAAMQAEKVPAASEQPAPMQGLTQKIRNDQLARQVLELRSAGFTYQEIRQVLGLKSDWQVWKLQRRALKEFYREDPTLLRRLDVARLDRLIRSLWRKSVQGDLPTLDRLIKLLQHRERYLQQWAYENKSGSIPRLTLLQALAADRQLESWLEQHRPSSPPSAAEELGS